MQLVDYAGISEPVNIYLSLLDFKPQTCGFVTADESSFDEQEE